MRQKFSRVKARALSIFLFIGILSILATTSNWWPGVFLLIGIPISLYQSMTGRLSDCGITLLVFVGAFVTLTFEIAWQIILPAAFSMGALYVLYRHFFSVHRTTQEEIEEEKEAEIEDLDE